MDKIESASGAEGGIELYENDEHRKKAGSKMLGFGRG